MKCCVDLLWSTNYKIILFIRTQSLPTA